ncbi:MAG: NADH:ubiquinone reductase (Na(+)-transporting) subunit C [Bacteroidales bacterium]|nr:NADH:ubiquinone reductase (Na(+)-transporting) subunit C [Bacteroidales bacterium]
MNTNSNTYTVVYSAIIVVIVSAVLAFAAQVLNPKQVANEKADTISQMLTAAGFGTKAEISGKGNGYILDTYKQSIKAAYTIDAKGNKVADLNSADAEIVTTSGLKAQNTNIKKGADVELPVYVLTKGGEEVTVLPIYGAGLWGPVWGYIAYKSDLKTIIGAYFDHASETPGLGGKITEPDFQGQFAGKQVDFSDKTPFAIVKGGAPAGKANAIDAITGATMTSNGVNDTNNAWLKAYEPSFAAAPAANEACEEAEEVETTNAEEE